MDLQTQAGPETHLQHDSQNNDGRLELFAPAEDVSA